MVDEMHHFGCGVEKGTVTTSENQTAAADSGPGPQCHPLLPIHRQWSQALFHIFYNRNRSFEGHSMFVYFPAFE